MVIDMVDFFTVVIRFDGLDLVRQVILFITV